MQRQTMGGNRTYNILFKAAWLIVSASERQYRIESRQRVGRLEATASRASPAPRSHRLRICMQHDPTPSYPQYCLPVVKNLGRNQRRRNAVADTCKTQRHQLTVLDIYRHKRSLDVLSVMHVVNRFAFEHIVVADWIREAHVVSRLTKTTRFRR